MTKMGARKMEVEATIEDIKLFGIERRIREALERLEKEFTDYMIDEVEAGLELGFPSGVKGSLTVSLKKKP